MEPVINPRIYDWLREFSFVMESYDYFKAQRDSSVEGLKEYFKGIDITTPEQKEKIEHLFRVAYKVDEQWRDYKVIRQKADTARAKKYLSRWRETTRQKISRAYIRLVKELREIDLPEEVIESEDEDDSEKPPEPSTNDPPADKPDETTVSRRATRKVANNNNSNNNESSQGNHRSNVVVEFKKKKKRKIPFDATKDISINLIDFMPIYDGEYNSEVSITEREDIIKEMQKITNRMTVLSAKLEKTKWDEYYVLGNPKNVEPVMWLGVKQKYVTNLKIREDLKIPEVIDLT